MQQGRNAPNEFKADKGGQHEDVKAGQQVELWHEPSSFARLDSGFVSI
jgi:hypothetical protein